MALNLLRNFNIYGYFEMRVLDRKQEAIYVVSYRLFSLLLLLLLQFSLICLLVCCYLKLTSVNTVSFRLVTLPWTKDRPMKGPHLRITA
jgi:hypothetical protein